MIKIVAQFFVRDGKLDEVLPLISELVKKTNEEKGCIAYDSFQNAKDKNHLFIIEEWESQAVLDIHSSSAHFTSLVPQISNLCSNPPIVDSLNKV